MIRRLDLRLLRFAAVGAGVAGFYILCFLALEAAGLPPTGQRLVVVTNSHLWETFPAYNQPRGLLHREGNREQR